MRSLTEGVLSGDRRALARSITLVESTRPDHRRQAIAVVNDILAATGQGTRLGISGTPGVGKSTFIEGFGLHVIDQGHRVAVLAVDPSSSLSGGSILGDKTRMGELARRSEAFIRPSPANGSLGGVARRTREVVLLCEAAGYDVVIVETVGVGQSETAVADMVDMFVLLVAPGGGDELQGIKRGVTELADLVVVNKADGELAAAAQRAAGEYRAALSLLRRKDPKWQPSVVACSALTLEGLPDVWKVVEEHQATLASSGRLQRLRSTQAQTAMWTEVRDALVDELRADAAVRAQLPGLESAVRAGTTTPTAAALALLAAFRSVRS